MKFWQYVDDLLAVLEPTGVIRQINPAWENLLGFSAEEIVGRGLSELIHEEDRKKLANELSALLVDHPRKLEIRVLRKDGSYCLVAWQFTSDGERFYGVGRDVTREKKQEEQLKQADQVRLHLALAAGEMGAWEWDLKTSEVSWLEGAAQVHGTSGKWSPFSVEEYMTYVHPEDRDALGDVMAEVAREGKNHHAEYRVVWEDGTVHWIEARGEMFFDELGEPSYMAGVSIDITRRKRAEKDKEFLVRATAELAALVEPQSTLDRLARLAVPAFADWCAIDMLADDGSLTRVSVAHADPGKVKLAEEIHRRFPPDPNIDEGTWGVIRSGRSRFISEITDAMVNAIIKDPDRRAMLKELGMRSYLAVPLSAHGKTTGVITFFAAESGRLYAEDDLLLAEELAHRAAVAIENAELYRELKAADRAKNIFLATLAHELRNPLAAIVSGLALVKLTSNDPERVEQTAAVMTRQSDYLTRLVDDLMDIARITSGKMELKKEQASLVSILNGAIEASRSAIEAAGHRLSVSLPGQPTPVLADTVRLAQVFSNLLTNAAKYTPHGGQIDVSVECPGPEYVVRVRDNGAGISSDMLEHVFKLFTQVKHPIETGDGGLGIGLAIVEGLVSGHGGSVEAHSAGPGKGSEFVVRLPRATAAEVPGVTSETAVIQASTTRALSVLVVDDNIDAASTLAEILRILGHKVLLENDGLSAVITALDSRPEVILMDLGLPGIDGYEAARRIRADERGKRSRLIAVSGWGQEEDKLRSREAGFDEHWVKPIGLDRLKNLL
ncbi:hypothetical protein NCCP691_37170 [Noviherbaspirillum aridicola]|uniref:histidine kinase n=1 Tax=Noviherbaspirillum aridicola TaxID=2849687 RepID=A0ABQ4Q910_9BURK|nr:hypothetical protein NCCP691_37170 [Noviherbaspirillum aridicola]